MLQSNRKHSLVLLLPKYHFMSKAAALAGSGDSVKQCTLFGNPGIPGVLPSSITFRWLMLLRALPGLWCENRLWHCWCHSSSCVQCPIIQNCFYFCSDGSPKHQPSCHLFPIQPRQRCFILTKDVVTISLKHCTILLRVETADFQLLTLILTMTFLSLKIIWFNPITVCRRMAVKYIYVLISST